MGFRILSLPTLDGNGVKLIYQILVHLRNQRKYRYVAKWSTPKNIFLNSRLEPLNLIIRSNLGDENLTKLLKKLFESRPCKQLFLHILISLRSNKKKIKFIQNEKQMLCWIFYSWFKGNLWDELILLFFNEIQEKSLYDCKLLFSEL